MLFKKFFFFFFFYLQYLSITTITRWDIYIHALSSSGSASYSRFELLRFCALLLFNDLLPRRRNSKRRLAEFFLGGIFALENIIHTRIFCLSRGVALRGGFAGLEVKNSLGKQRYITTPRIPTPVIYSSLPIYTLELVKKSAKNINQWARTTHYYIILHHTYFTCPLPQKTT